MRFLIDNSVSWRLAERLREVGHDALHVRDIGMADAADADIYLRSIGESRTIITQDVDFGYLLASSADATGCVILLRLTSGRVEDQWQRVSALLERYSPELVPATIIVLTETNMRIRRF